MISGEGGVSGLVACGDAGVYQQATAPKPSTTSLQERANLVVELSEVEGCVGGLDVNVQNKLNVLLNILGH